MVSFNDILNEGKMLRDYYSQMFIYDLGEKRLVGSKYDWSNNGTRYHCHPQRFGIAASDNDYWDDYLIKSFDTLEDIPEILNRFLFINVFYKPYDNYMDDGVESYEILNLQPKFIENVQSRAMSHQLSREKYHIAPDPTYRFMLQEYLDKYVCNKEYKGSWKSKINEYPMIISYTSNRHPAALAALESMASFTQTKILSNVSGGSFRHQRGLYSFDMISKSSEEALLFKVLNAEDGISVEILKYDFSKLGERIGMVEDIFNKLKPKYKMKLKKSIDGLDLYTYFDEVFYGG